MTEYSEIIFRDSHYFLLIIVSIAFIIYFLFKKKNNLLPYHFLPQKFYHRKVTIKKE